MIINCIARSRINSQYNNLADKLNKGLTLDFGGRLITKKGNLPIGKNGFALLFKRIYEQGYKDALEITNFKILENV